MSHTLFVNNQWIEGRGLVFSSLNPASQDEVWRGASADYEDIDEAIESAHAAFSKWAQLPIEERYEYLKTYASILESDKDKFAELISIETGKPLWEAKTEVSAMVGKIDLSWEAYQERCSTKHIDVGNTTAVLRYKPIGVTVVLGPFNLPGHLPNGHFVPALLAGNTVVFKPSELTPAVGAKIAEYIDQANFPAGVFNLVQGASEAGKYLSNHPKINGLFFTGSYETGSAIHKSFAGKPEKMLALEMGGNNPLIVHDLERVDAAVYLALLSSFITTGQRCVCARRLILTDSKNTEVFLSKFIEATSKLSYGPYTQSPEPFMGPLISIKQAKSVQKQYDKLISLGAKPLCELTVNPKIETLLSPAILEVNEDMALPDQEIFGPVVQIYHARSLDDAIALANKTEYGLSAGILCDDAEAYQTFSTLIKAGVVNWNRQITGASSRMPFGGVGKSGNFRPSGYFAVDYCSYPVASLEYNALEMPDKLLPGISI